ncbi:Stk1 family PASTA domain-containing Ser/Thr kinase [Aerococcaceae bacterium NML210727]|nr:Stk1 family PASTA domain-containing Ser/Thr kinase [Aerococcaceae bacterium NML210727]
MEIGDKLSGRYELTGTIGQGGMANVFLARDLILDREVAVKVLRFDFKDNPDAVRRFRREAVSASQLLHHNIVEIYDVEEKEGQQYIVMEYVQGTDLKTFIRQHAPLSLELVVSIMSQILAAIEIAHRNKIIHRDIKPQNILITANNEVKITDFGIAIALSDTSITQTNTLLGSVHYLSPEQARGSNATPRTDIYALGVVLYELITGTVPYDGESAVSVALKHFQEEFPRIKDTLEYVPQSLENVVLRATAKNPEHRYESVQSMLADLSTSLSASRMNEAMFKPNERLSNRANTIQPIKPIAPKKVPKSIEREDNYDVIAPMTPQPKRNRWFLKVIAVLIFLVVSVSGTYYMYTQATRYVAVPDVTNMAQADAEALLAKYHLTVSNAKQEWSDTVPQGSVIQSNPKASTRVAKNTGVELVVSNGKEQVEILDYRGMDYETVRKQLIDKGFIVESKGFASTPENIGKILEQSEQPGSRLVPNKTPITFTVGALADSSRMQDFYNLPLAMAQRFADQYGLILHVEQAFDDYVPEGRIIEQSLPNGVSLGQGDEITVTVSKGPEKVSELMTIVNIDVEYLPVYAPSDRDQKKPLPNTIQVYIGDNRNNIRNIAFEEQITESKDITIRLYILENGVGQYRVLRNGEVIAESNEVYPGE